MQHIRAILNSNTKEHYHDVQLPSQQQSRVHFFQKAAFITTPFTFHPFNTRRDL